MAIIARPGNLPHIKWIDLKNDGVLIECAVMKEDDFGNIYFIQVNQLDSIDRRRLARILQNRNAQNFELWDLMSNITLNNGINALTYFHQLVKVITPTGVVSSPKQGEVGTGYVRTTQQPVAESQPDVVPGAPRGTKKSTKVSV
jgi:hypothetical protein